LKVLIKNTILSCLLRRENLTKNLLR